MCRQACRRIRRVSSGTIGLHFRFARRQTSSPPYRGSVCRACRVWCLFDVTPAWAGLALIPSPHARKAWAQGQAPRQGQGRRSPHAPQRRDCTHVARDNIGDRFQNILRRGGVDIDIGPPHKSGSPSRPCPTRTPNLPEIPKPSLALPDILTRRSNPAIFQADLPKSGAKWPQKTDLPKETLPAGAGGGPKAPNARPR
jgi:hypothetical protein